MKMTATKVLAITALLGAYSVPAYADFNCEVYISQNGPAMAGEVGTLNIYSEDIPHFRTSGSALFYWGPYYGNVGVFSGETAFRPLPTRAKKCMADAADRTFSSDAAMFQIFDEILEGQGDINAKTKFCTASNAMPFDAYGGMNNGFNFKFKARKVTNRNAWLFKYLDVRAPKSYCASYYKPSCFGVEPDDADTVEPWGGESLMDTTDDLWNDDGSSGAVEDPADITLPDAPPPPPPTEYCEPEPFELQVPRSYATSPGGTGAWGTGSSGTYNSLSDYIIADFSGDGLDDYFNPASGKIRSLRPSSDFKERCKPRPQKPRGFFGNPGTPFAFKSIVSCLPTDDRGGNLRRFKVLEIDAQASKLMKIEGGLWSTYDTASESWMNQFPHGTTSLTYDERAYIPASMPLMPANLSQYKHKLRADAGKPAHLAFGDFYGDGHDDAFVIYDDKWWVSNDLTGPWIIIADLNHLTNVPLERILEKAILVPGGGLLENEIPIRKSSESTIKEKAMLAKPRESTSQIKSAPVQSRSMTTGRSQTTNRSSTRSLSIGIQKHFTTDAIQKSFGNSVVSTRRMHIADFTGDGTDDIFVTHEGNWYIFKSGGARYTRLRSSSVAINSLKFGDFNGDGKMDVYEKDGARLRYYSSGKGQAINLQTSPNSLAEIHTIKWSEAPKDGLFTAIED